MVQKATRTSVLLNIGYIPSNLLPFADNMERPPMTYVACTATMHTHQLKTITGTFRVGDSSSLDASSLTGIMIVSFEYGADAVFAVWYLPEEFPSTSFPPLIVTTFGTTTGRCRLTAIRSSALLSHLFGRFNLARFDSDTKTITSHSFSTPWEGGDVIVGPTVIDEGLGILWTAVMGGPTGLRLHRVRL